ncbi:IS110 family RNA-guided transposase [Komagataeibacter diospyri]|uniref:Transposase n=1 Tax=Komagataeibacter diospyri TaxID=1932662 RepID=A0A4P5NKN8_9PROT|nr:IS110 family transposase [Komagataeibacter diospyri]GCE82049.1 transposase [Komagataeibacter diospyri]
MGTISTIGLDLAKNVFQVHGIDSLGNVLVRRRLRRSEVIRFFETLSPCLVGIEACGTSHYWARTIAAFGHTVKMMPAIYVKPYVKRGKTDAADAEAICEAVTRPTMRFVPVKSPDQQAALLQHKTRDLLVRQRTMQINALRGHLAEFGIISAAGVAGLNQMIALLHAEQEALPEPAQKLFQDIIAHLRALEQRIDDIEKQIVAAHKANSISRRLAGIPGIGPITASAIVAAVPDVSTFRSGRQFAAWLGLTPKNHSSGGKERQVGISKQGDSYLRRLLVLGATAVIRLARKESASRQWAAKLLEKKAARVVSVALANKTARIVWAVLTTGNEYSARSA